MGRQIQVRIAAFVPLGRVHTNDSPAALQGRTEYAPLNLDSDKLIDLEFLRRVYCLIANRADPSIAEHRRPDAIRAFAVWWREGSEFITADQQTWETLGVREEDLLVLLTEPPDCETRSLVDLVLKQTDAIDADARKKAIAEAVTEGLQATHDLYVRNRRKPIPGRVFIAMPMNEHESPELADTHDSLKNVCGSLGLSATRVDDVQTNHRITDTIRNLIDECEFVIADLSDNRPNVFFEAGYAEGVGKTPVYIARTGTDLQFDVKDYPVIFFENQRALRHGVLARLKELLRDRTVE